MKEILYKLATFLLSIVAVGRLTLLAFPSPKRPKLSKRRKRRRVQREDGPPENLPSRRRKR